MIQKINNRSRGQTALILILLTAAAMIFLAITLNWGRIAQQKSTVTIAADQAGTMLGSYVASYGEMNKQTYLQNTNKISSFGGYLMAIIMVVVAIIVLIITCGAGAAASAFMIACAVAAVVMAVVNLVLQMTVVQPGITAMWNKLQQNQPIVQQFYEGGVGSALQGVVGDQVNVTDYFDWNTDGIFGVNSSNTSNDTVGRFAVYYTDRLKMLNVQPIPQINYFYNQLGEFLNGETCAENASDHSVDSNIPINPACNALDNSPIVSANPYCFNAAQTASNYCLSCATDPACQMKISNYETCAQNAVDHSSNAGIPINAACPNDCILPANASTAACQQLVQSFLSFQLNDACPANSTPGGTYNPYCDPCCQILNVPNPAYSSSNPLQPKYKSIRPSSCPLPPGCDPKNPSAANCIPAECASNNPYGGSTYPYLYDSSYQNYPDQLSFLAQYGRDVQTLPETSTTASGARPILASMGAFPNGIYPFFWKMKDFSLEVDNINNLSTTPLATNFSLPSSQGLLHWCTASVEPLTPSYTAPAGFPDLVQLGAANSPYALSAYTCSGFDCCVNYLPDGVTSLVPVTAGPITLTVGGSGATGPKITSFTLPASSHTDASGHPVFQMPTSVTITATAAETGGAFINSGFSVLGGENFQNTTYTSPVANSITFSHDISFPPQGTTMLPAMGELVAQAEDTNDVTVTSGTTGNAANLTLVAVLPPTTTPVSVSGALVNGSSSAATLTATASEILPTGETAPTGMFASGTFSYSLSASGPWTVLTGTANPTVTTGAGGIYTTTYSMPWENLPTVSVSTTYYLKFSTTDIYGYSATSPVTSVLVQPAATGGSSSGSGSSGSGSSGSGGSSGSSSGGAVEHPSAEKSFAVPNGNTITSPGTISPPGTSPTTTPTTSPTSSATITAAPAGSPSTTKTSFPPDSTILLSATFTGVTGITGVMFYDAPISPAASCPAAGDTSWSALGTSSTTSSPYQFLWNPVSGGTYCVEAIATYPGNSLNPTTNLTTNGVIDMVGDLSLSGLAYTTNPASDASFGEPGASAAAGPNGTTPAPASWVEGDNQFCSATWPYNGLTSIYPDGTCEISNSTSPTSNGQGTSSATIDNLDDVTHTLSDFLKFSNTVLASNPAALSSAFDNWYPQMASWIAPACSGNGACGGTIPSCTASNESGPGSGCAEADNYESFCSGNTSCNSGSDGRLLSIYEPANYPIGNAAATPPMVDKLNDWNNVITKWLSNNYTPSGAASAAVAGTNPHPVWCVPMEASLKIGNVPTAEDSFITGNSSSSNWAGDLSHVVACLNYNSGQNSNTAQATINYQTCLNALSQMNANNTCSTTSCTAGNACFPPECQASVLGAAPNLSSGIAPTFTGNGHDCDPNWSGSFANWVNNNVNYGPVYNYTQCKAWLGSCPTLTSLGANGLAGTPCDPVVLGRSLDVEKYDLYDGSANSCSSTYVSLTTKNSSFAKWVSDSQDLFTDEQPKFIKRAQFLTDIQNRAITMQNIFTKGDIALHNFMKTCTGCANPNASCTDNKCSDDGSSCGSPKNQCEDGGPAAQLMYARSQPSVAQNLPNAVIYGWTDKTMPNGQVRPLSCATGACNAATDLCPDGITQCTGGAGYAHIVKVTAYSPGRNGNPSYTSPGFILQRLPWITTYSDISSRTFELVDRDGYVYARVQRWDEGHGASVTFPNNHSLWQYLFHNPRNSTPDSDNKSGLPPSCIGLSGGKYKFGFGFMPCTVQGLAGVQTAACTQSFTAPVINNGNGLLQQDQWAFQNAYMLNDEGDGMVDPNLTPTDGSKALPCVDSNLTPTDGSKALPGSPTSAGTAGSLKANYCQCMYDSNQRLSYGVQSQSCVEYIASRNVAQPSSGDGDADYGLKFVDCNTLNAKSNQGNPWDDLSYGD